MQRWASGKVAAAWEAWAARARVWRAGWRRAPPLSPSQARRRGRRRALRGAWRRLHAHAQPRVRLASALRRWRRAALGAGWARWAAEARCRVKLWRAYEMAWDAVEAAAKKEGMSAWRHAVRPISADLRQSPLVATVPPPISH